MTQYFASRGADAALARHEAIVAIGNSIRQQSFVMAYSDMFVLMGLALIGALIALLFVKRIAAGSKTVSGGH
jgi:DHA2 family multidrug resistance protein